MTAVTVEEFAADIYKYLDFDNFKPFAIAGELGQRITLAMPKAKKKEEGRMATQEELEMFRIAEENYEKGNCYKKLRTESWEEFFERIEANPENELVCMK